MVPRNDKFISFDVASLFTNIPLKLTLDFLERKLSTFNLNIDSTIPNECLIELIKLCTIRMYFRHNNNFFEQSFGLATGNPFVSHSSLYILGTRRIRDPTHLHTF